jgi:hypothetical protein
MFTVSDPNNRQMVVGEFTVSQVAIDDHHEVAVRHGAESWETIFVTDNRGTATRAYSAVGNMILKGMDPREWLLRWNGQNIVAFR